MLDNDTVLSPDLDWMLQSGQVSREVLTEYLLREQYTPLYRFVLAISEDAKAAERIAIQTIETALLEVHHYHGELSALPWLYRFALDAVLDNRSGESLSEQAVFPSRWQKLLAPLPLGERILLILLAQDGWSEDHVSRLLLLQDGELDGQKARALRRFAEAAAHVNLRAAGVPGPPPQDSPTSARWDWATEVLQRLKPELYDGPHNENWLSAAVLYLSDSVGRRNTTLQRLTSAKELLLTVLVSILVILGILAVDRYLPEQNPAGGSVVETQYVYMRVTATPVPKSTPIPAVLGQSKTITRVVLVEDGESLVDVAERLNVSVEMLRSLSRVNDNELLPEQELRLVIGPDGEVMSLSATIPTPTPDASLLNLRSTDEDIRRKLETSYRNWTSLWYEAQLVDYGPAGFVGEPRVRHEQVWVKQPYHALVLTGRAGQQPDTIWFTFNGKVYDVDTISGKPRVYDFHSGQLRVYSEMERFIFSNQFAREGGAFHPRAWDQAGGRMALVVDWFPEPGYNQYRLWIDPQYGIIVRMIELEPGHGAVRRIYTIKRIEINPELPSDIFDRGSLLLEFASDYRGGSANKTTLQAMQYVNKVPGHTSLGTETPPPDFDPGLYGLVFQWRRNPQDGGKVPVNIYAGSFYLRSMMLSNPGGLACTRSPDGETIAFYEELDTWPPSTSPLSLLSLRGVNLPPQSVPGLLSTHGLSFSPSGDTLAFGGCSEDDGCGVFLLDVSSGDYRLLRSLAFAGYPIWNPDGKELAVVASVSGEEVPHLVLIDIASGEIRYQNPYEPGGPLPEDAPLNAWNLSLPTEEHPNTCFQPVK